VALQHDLDLVEDLQRPEQRGVGLHAPVRLFDRRGGGDRAVVGDRTRPLSIALTVADDGTVSATATVKQSEWGMKPYSALFGTLKVLDEVEIALEGHL